MTETARPGRGVAATVEATDELPFLSRWSRRKLGQELPLPAEPPSAPEPRAVAEAEVSPADAPAEPVDPRTGKRMSELTDEDMPDIESLDENSDLAAFMAGQVSRGLRMKALTKVFHTAKFNQICLCAEYADDYTSFTPLGDIVPHDLQQAIVREAGKLYDRVVGKGLQMTPEEAQARVAAEFRGEHVPAIEGLDSTAEDSEDGAGGNLRAGPVDQQPEGAFPPGKPEAT